MTLNSRQVKSSPPGKLDLLGASVSDGRYEVQRLLGKGSMGYVYSALDRNLDTEVVLKIPTMARLENPDFRRRFLQESRFLVRLTHPSVISILDVGEYNEIPYFVMKYVGGGSLESRQYDQNRVKQQMSLDSLRTWLPSMSAALDFIHTKNCVHRDMKPANILFDEQGNAFLSDFGLSKLVLESDEQEDSSMTAAGAVVGTPSYVAPEIVLGRSYDGRADQYSLATTVYEVLTAQVPMEGPSASATIVNQTTKKLVNPREHNSKIPLAVAKVIMKGMAKRQDERFASCSDFSKALFRAWEMSKMTQPVPGSGVKFVVKATSKGKRGKVPCPKCRKVLIIQPEHKGKRAKCSKCSSQLAISKNLKELQLIERVPGSGAFESSQDEMTMLVGQELFGFKLNAQQALIALVALIAIAVAGALIALQRMGTDELDALNRSRMKINTEQTSRPAD